MTIARDSSPQHIPPPGWRKLAVLFGFFLVAGIAVYLLREHISLAVLSQHEMQLRAWYQQYPATAIFTAFIVYWVATSLSVPTIWPLSVAYGWLFGFMPALLIISFASTAGATVAMLLSRFVLHDAVERRFGSRLQAIHRGIAREGALYLLTLRLIPLIPFFLVNLLMGLTRMRVRTFWWASQIGMLPATAVYAWAGASVPSLEELTESGIRGLLRWQLVAALVLLAILPLAMRWLVRRVHRGI